MKQTILLFLAQALCLSAFSQSTFIVTSTGTNPEVDAAIEYATDIWSLYLNSDVPIEINLSYANYSDLGILGQCLPNLRQNFPNAPIEDVWYLTSLANSIAGIDVAPDEVDMDLLINSDANYYFGLDGNTPSNQIDLVTLLLHEIGHGLGFISLGDLADGIGSIGVVPSLPLLPPTSFGFPETFEEHPCTWDLFMVNGTDLLLADAMNFENNSEELGNELVSEDLYYNGATAVSANFGDNPKLYAPTEFFFGSSLLHLDENSFPLSSGNSLMTPFLNFGDVEHNPGSITLGILQDLGWDLNMTVGIADYDEEIFQVYPNPSNGNLTIKLDAIDFDLNLMDLLGNQVADHLVNGQNQLNGLSNGTYIIRGTVDGAFVSKRLVLID